MADQFVETMQKLRDNMMQKLRRDNMQTADAVMFHNYHTMPRVPCLTARSQRGQAAKRISCLQEVRILHHKVQQRQYLNKNIERLIANHAANKGNRDG